MRKPPLRVTVWAISRRTVTVLQTQKLTFRYTPFLYKCLWEFTPVWLNRTFFSYPPTEISVLFKLVEGEPCKYYNSGGCRDRDRCTYLHVCKYALQQNCRYGSKCKLNHNIDGGASSGGYNEPADETEGCKDRCFHFKPGPLSFSFWDVHSVCISPMFEFYPITSSLDVTQYCFFT